MADESYSGETIDDGSGTGTATGTGAETETEEGDSPFGSLSVPPRYLFGLVGLGLLVVLPFVGLSTTDTLVLIGSSYFGMFAMSWDAVSGYIGEISFGHALFFAVGGYTSALLNLGYGISPAITIPAGVVLAAVAGALIGVPALRIRGPYLSLITLVAPLILLQFFIVYGDIFGGELGLGQPEGIVTADSFELAVLANYYVALGLFVFILLVLFAVTRSDAGSVLTAIREDEDAVEAAGINASKFKVFAFVLSAAVGGLAGAVFVHTPAGGPQPSQLLTLLVSIEVLIAAILGGMGTIVGAGLGGMFFYYFNDFLNQQDATIPLVGVGINEASLLIFALLTIVVLSVLPEGVFPWAIRTGRRLYGGARGDSAVADGGGYSHRNERSPLEQTTRKFRRSINDVFGESGHDERNGRAEGNGRRGETEGRRPRNDHDGERR